MAGWTLALDHETSGYYVNTATGDKLRIEREMYGEGPLYHYQVVYVYPDGVKTLVAVTDTLIWDTHPECRVEDVHNAINELGRMQLIVADILELR
jgi:hypothetical protein